MTAPPAELLTERLRLRPYRAADLDAYAEMNADPEVMVFLGNRPMQRAESDGMAGEINACFFERGYGKLAVERRSDGAFLGMCGLSRERWFTDDLEVGWRLLPRYWGQGYATEAGAAWLAHAFEALGQRRIVSVADVPNVRSIAVMERLGMGLVEVAQLDDGDGGTFAAAVHAIDRTQWLARAGRSG